MLLAEKSAWPFDAALKATGINGLRRGQISTLQINLGKRCNQACLHCHVEAGPKRTEMMSSAVAERIVEVLTHSKDITTLDITGGAPELNENFRWLVTQATELGLSVIDRCNLTIFFEPGMQGLPQFLAEHRVRVVASLPCYSEGNVDAQRGKGVFDKSLRGLQLLNELGYAGAGTGLTLDLVYNPGGAFLPPPQGELEATYRTQLADNFGIEFNSLLTLTNLPVRRFADSLRRKGELGQYMKLLVDNFNPTTVAGLMCISQISVGWDGAIYDCDFNQMLEMPACTSKANIMDLESVEELENLQVATGPHCFGCTAGAGSSCGGSIA